MKHLLLICCASMLLFSTAYSLSVQQYSLIGNLRLESGDTLFDCSVGYRTFGTLNKERSNAILFCTWYMGNSADLESSIGENAFADSTKYFVIAIDALCDGVSSSPSNCTRQPGEKFPIVTIGDMVKSQYMALKKEFGITQLHGIIGGSMGGMQVFEWIVAYPDFMKKAVATVGSPQLSTYNRLLFSVLHKIIENGKKYSMSDPDRTALYLMTYAIVLRTPEFINKEIPPEKFQEYIRSFEEDTITSTRFIDLAYQLHAMIGHNIYRFDDNNIEASVKKISARLLLILAERDLTVNPEPALQFAKLKNARIITLTNNCGHMAPGCDFKRCSKDILEFFNGD